MACRRAVVRLLSTRVPARVHVAGAGGVQGMRRDGKKSTEMRFRGESLLVSVRRPKRTRWPIARWKVVRGDTVEVISGPDCGKRGKVIEVVRPSNRIVVQGVGFVDKYEEAMGEGKGIRVRTEAPIHVSNVMVVCPQTLKKSKVGYAFLEDGTKVRIAKRSGAIIPRPEILMERRVPFPKDDGPKDTPADIVTKVTYKDENGLYEKYQGFARVIENSGVV